MLIGACVIALGIGSYLCFMASNKCMKGSLFAIGQSTNDKPNQHILDQFVEFMQFHAQIKQLSTEMKITKFQLSSKLDHSKSD